MCKRLLEFVFTNKPIYSYYGESYPMLKGSVGSLCFACFREDDDLAESIKKTAQQNNVKAGAIIVIGALRQVVLGCYRNGEYVNTNLKGQFEIASCTGNLAIDEKGETVVHAHIVVSNEKGQAFGGHLQKGCVVRPTAELIIIEATGINLQRVLDERTKLKLLKLS
jgi:predicted DNA-binding protein with PD1-like motif